MFLPSHHFPAVGRLNWFCICCSQATTAEAPLLDAPHPISSGSEMKRKVNTHSSWFKPSLCKAIQAAMLEGQITTSRMLSVFVHASYRTNSCPSLNIWLLQHRINLKSVLQLRLSWKHRNIFPSSHFVGLPIIPVTLSTKHSPPALYRWALSACHEILKGNAKMISGLQKAPEVMMLPHQSHFRSPRPAELHLSSYRDIFKSESAFPGNHCEVLCSCNNAGLWEHTQL